jgi:hypothetical protein
MNSIVAWHRQAVYVSTVTYPEQYILERKYFQTWNTLLPEKKTENGGNMVNLKLSFACWDYDRVKAIEDGRVRPEGIDLTFLNYRVEET